MTTAYTEPVRGRGRNLAFQPVILTKPLPAGGWQRLRTGLASWGQLANVADLGTTVAGLTVGGREVGFVPALLIGRGYPEAVVLVAIKIAAALTIWGLWKAAGAPRQTSVGRIGVLSGLGGMVVLAGLLTWAVVHNVAVLMGF